MQVSDQVTLHWTNEETREEGVTSFRLNNTICSACTDGKVLETSCVHALQAIRELREDLIAYAFTVEDAGAWTVGVPLFSIGSKVMTIKGMIDFRIGRRGNRLGYFSVHIPGTSPALPTHDSISSMGGQLHMLGTVTESNHILDLAAMAGAWVKTQSAIVGSEAIECDSFSHEVVVSRLPRQAPRALDESSILLTGLCFACKSAAENYVNDIPRV